MKKMVLLIMLALPLGCQTKPGTSAVAASTGGVSKGGGVPASLETALINRAWARSDASELPGIIRIFLGNGTLLTDSCWETYRLSQWRMESDSTVLWNEDGMDIRADVIAVDAQALVLSLRLVSGAEVQHYAPAAVPFVCPDMPR